MLFSELGWESLQTRRDKHKLITFYKIWHGLAPIYLANLVPPLVQDILSYNLRNSDHIQNFQANTKLFRDSFFPSTIRAWNSLPDDIKQALSAASFKYRLNKNLKRHPRYYNSGTCTGQVLQARLRMQCSSINADISQEHSETSFMSMRELRKRLPLLFFACPRFTAERRRYLQDTLPYLYSVKITQRNKITQISSYKCTIILSSQVDLCNVYSSCPNNIKSLAKFVPCHEVGYPASLSLFLIPRALYSFLLFASSSHVYYNLSLSLSLPLSLICISSFNCLIRFVWVYTNAIRQNYKFQTAFPGDDPYESCYKSGEIWKTN